MCVCYWCLLCIQKQINFFFIFRIFFIEMFIFSIDIHNYILLFIHLFIYAIIYLLIKSTPTTFQISIFKFSVALYYTTISNQKDVFY